MNGSAGKIKLASLEDFFGTAQAPSEPFQEISLSDLHPFKGHPFHVMDDEKMQEMAESVAQHEVLVPGIVRPRPEGGYELVSGHRRKRACELAGLETMPVFVRELDDDEAVLIMVDSNLQREKILPSEKAFAYRMKLEAMKHQGQRVDLTSRPVGTRSDELLAGGSPDSARQIQRYIRLTYLLPPLLQMVDENKLALRPAVELSHLTQEEQGTLLKIMGRLAVVPTLEQAQRLKKYSRDGQLTKMNEKLISVKASPLGQDFQDVLFEKQRSGTLDIDRAIMTLKEYLVQDLSPGGLKYLYPTYFDAARVLIAEFVAEFFQTGRIYITALDPCRMKYVEHGIRQISFLQEDVSRLLRVLRRVQEPTHGLYLRHKMDAACWIKHIQAVYQTISLLQ